MENAIRYSINQEPIVLSPVTLAILSNPREEKHNDLLVLYIFYYRTAKWQGTNKTKATTSFAAKGVGWSIKRVRRAKNRLIELGLVENVIRKNKKTKQVIGHYIQVNFIHSFNDLHPQNKNAKATPEVFHRVEFDPPNAYDITKVISLSINSKDTINTNRNTKRLKREADDARVRKVTPKMFEIFWKLYPKKKSKGAALIAWEKICNKPAKNRPDWLEVRKAIKKQSETVQWQNSQFIPNGSTWLNQKRWLDDPEEMNNIPNYDKPQSQTKTGYKKGKLKYKKAEKV